MDSLFGLVSPDGSLTRWWLGLCAAGSLLFDVAHGAGMYLSNLDRLLP